MKATHACGCSSPSRRSPGGRRRCMEKRVSTHCHDVPLCRLEHFCLRRLLRYSACPFRPSVRQFMRDSSGLRSGEAPIETRCVKSEPSQWRDPNNGARPPGVVCGMAAISPSIIAPVGRCERHAGKMSRADCTRRSNNASLKWSRSRCFSLPTLARPTQ